MWWLVACTPDPNPATDASVHTETPTAGTDWTVRSVRKDWLRRWTGTEPDDEVGTATCADDFDGDGVPELIVSAPSTFVYGPEADLPHGSVARLAWNAPDGALDAAVLGEITGWKNGDRIGASLACPGDLDGDGAPDVALGGELAEEPPVFVAVVDGQWSASTGVDEAVRTRIVSDASTNGAEDMVACGDVNADGIHDLCTFTNGAIHDPLDRAYVFAGPLSVGDRAVEQATTTFRGPVARYHGGGGLGGTDFDGDGTNDLVFGVSEVDDNDGGVFLVTSVPTGVQPLPTSSYWAGEPGVGGNTGSTFAAGDLDGDGSADLFVGAHIADGRVGRGYVLTDPLAGGDIGAAPIRMFGDQPFGWFGWRAAVGDFDGDGQSDLAVSIPRDLYLGLDQPGRVALFLGPMTPGDLHEADADLVFRASDDPDSFGWSLLAVDADGDGDHELVVGAPHDGQPVSSRGAVYTFDPSAWF